MQRPISLFALFGGIRPMAAALRERPSTVYTWRNVNRIPADKQRKVIETGIRLGLAVSPELIIYPSGIVPECVVRAANAHRLRITPHLVAAGLDRSGIGSESSPKYGKARNSLHTCEQMVAA